MLFPRFGNIRTIHAGNNKRKFWTRMTVFTGLAEVLFSGNVAAASGNRASFPPLGDCQQTAISFPKVPLG